MSISPTPATPIPDAQVAQLAAAINGSLGDVELGSVYHPRSDNDVGQLRFTISLSAALDFYNLSYLIERINEQLGEDAGVIVSIEKYTAAYEFQSSSHDNRNEAEITVHIKSASSRKTPLDQGLEQLAKAWNENSKAATEIPTFAGIVEELRSVLRPNTDIVDAGVEFRSGGRPHPAGASSLGFIVSTQETFRLPGVRVDFDAWNKQLYGDTGLAPDEWPLRLTYGGCIGNPSPIIDQFVGVKGIAAQISAHPELARKFLAKLEESWPTISAELKTVHPSETAIELLLKNRAEVYDMLKSWGVKSVDCIPESCSLVLKFDNPFTSIGARIVLEKVAEERGIDLNNIETLSGADSNSIRISEKLVNTILRMQKSGLIIAAERI